MEYTHLTIDELEKILLERRYKLPQRIAVTYQDKIVYIPNVNNFSLPTQSKKVIAALRHDLGVVSVHTRKGKNENKKNNNDDKKSASSSSSSDNNNEYVESQLAKKIWRALKMKNIVRNPVQVQAAREMSREDIETAIANRAMPENGCKLNGIYLPKALQEKPSYFIINILDTIEKQEEKEDETKKRKTTTTSTTTTAELRKKICRRRTPKPKLLLQQLPQRYSSDADRMRRGRFSQLRATLNKTRPVSARFLLSVNKNVPIDSIVIPRRAFYALFSSYTNEKTKENYALVCRYPIISGAQVTCMRVLVHRDDENNDENNKNNDDNDRTILSCAVPMSWLGLQNADNDGDTLSIFPLLDPTVAAEALILCSPIAKPFAQGEAVLQFSHDIVLYMHVSNTKYSLIRAWEDAVLSGKIDKFVERFVRTEQNCNEHIGRLVPPINVANLEHCSTVRALIASRATRMTEAALDQFVHSIGEINSQGTSERRLQNRLRSSYTTGLSLSELGSAVSASRGAISMSKIGMHCMGNTQSNVLFTMADMYVSHDYSVRTTDGILLSESVFSLFDLKSCERGALSKIYESMKNSDRHFTFTTSSS